MAPPRLKCILCDRSRTSQDLKVFCYKFPHNNPSQYDAWLRACRITEEQERDMQPRVCSMCFSKDSFTEDSEMCNRLKLKSGAVPRRRRAELTNDQHEFVKVEVTADLTVFDSDDDLSNFPPMNTPLDPVQTDIQRKCRMCLEVLEKDFQNDLTSNLAKLFKNLTSTALSTSKDLPQKVCTGCVSLLNNFCYTKMKFVQNQLKLEASLDIKEDFLVEELSPDEDDDEVKDEPNESNDWQEIDEENDPTLERLTNDYTAFESNEDFQEIEYDAVAKVKSELFGFKPEKTVKRRKRQSKPMSKDEKYQRWIQMKNRLCDECDYKTYSEHFLAAHKFRHHGGPEPTRDFICDQCPKAFKSKFLLGRHQGTHVSVKKYNCDHCPYKTNARADMARHCERHFFKIEKKLTCKYDGCGETFKSYRGLKVHTNSVHLKELPFDCHICAKRFALKAVLTDHIKTVHIAERNYKCDVEGCKDSFLNNNHLRRHKKDVHEKLRPFECEICQATFKQPYHLKRHAKEVHKIEDFQAPKIPRNRSLLLKATN